MNKYKTEVIVIQKSIIHTTKSDFVKNNIMREIECCYVIIHLHYALYLETTNIEIFISFLEEIHYRVKSNPKIIIHAIKSDFVMNNIMRDIDY